MIGDVVVRCGARSIILAEIDEDGAILSAESRSVDVGSDIEYSSEAWLQAFAKTVAQLPKKTRKRIVLITPPNVEVFIKQLRIPEVTEKSVQEAFRFECEHEFPGGAEEWCWDIYQAKNQNQCALGIAIRRAFSERFVDVLIRNKIQISYICPEILLNTVAVQNNVDSAANSIVLHVGEYSSHLACLGDNVEYFRMLPVAAGHLTKTVAELQKISISQAEKLQSEFMENKESENRAFMTYYAKQFVQKLNQELKKSELFYCRTFRQPPTTKLYLTGHKRKLYSLLSSDDRNMKIIDLFDVLKKNIAPGVSGEEVEIIGQSIGTFVGAAHCLRNKQTGLLNLFSADFSNQVDFQRQHLGYLLVFIAFTLLALTGMKALKKDVLSLATKKTELEAKLLEASIDTARYEELSKERTELRAFIENTKFAFYSQYAWADLFNEIQSKIEILETAWIESLSWEDRKDDGDHDRIKVLAKMLVIDDVAKKSAGELVENFIKSIGKMDSADGLDNVHIYQHDENILAFSFDIRLKQQSRLLIK
ncbi:MAG: hypothetical protein LBB18_02505 [Puniceicoccales bacterium]|jgi:hypothetical protein|nr:hypothetical protein [Puniceicoccales bacterium]